MLNRHQPTVSRCEIKKQEGNECDGHKGRFLTFNQEKAPVTIGIFSVIVKSSRTFVWSSIVHSQDIQRVAWHCLGHANCEEDVFWCRFCKNMELTFASFSERIKWGDGNLQYGTDWHWLIATVYCRSLQCWTEMLYNIVGKESGPKMK